MFAGVSEKWGRGAGDVSIAIDMSIDNGCVSDDANDDGNDDAGVGAIGEGDKGCDAAVSFVMVVVAWGSDKERSVTVMEEGPSCWD